MVSLKERKMIKIVGIRKIRILVIACMLISSGFISINIDTGNTDFVVFEGICS